MKKALLFVVVVAFWVAIIPFYLFFIERRTLAGTTGESTKARDELKVIEERA